MLDYRKIIVTNTYIGTATANKITECLTPAITLPSEIFPIAGPANIPCTIIRYKKYLLKLTSFNGVAELEAPLMVIDIVVLDNIGKNTI